MSVCLCGVSSVLPTRLSAVCPFSFATGRVMLCHQADTGILLFAFGFFAFVGLFVSRLVCVLLGFVTALAAVLSLFFVCSAVHVGLCCARVRSV